MKSVPKLGVGLAYQAPLRSVIESDHDCLDFVEVVPDILWTDLGPGERPRYVDDQDGVEYLNHVHRSRAVIPHSIGLSIGSAHHFDRDHIAQVRRWWEHFQFPWHSDHLAYHLAEYQARQVNVGITVPLPRDRQTLDLLIPRIDEILRQIPVPFLLENNVYYFEIPDDEMDEAVFLNTLCSESGCGLLLDLHNLYVNSRNHRFDPKVLLERLNLESVGEIHVAGGMELDGFYLDAHSGPIPEPVWSLLEWSLPRCPNLGGVTFELFGSWFETVGGWRVRQDLRRIKGLWQRAFGAPRGPMSASNVSAGVA